MTRFLLPMLLAAAAHGALAQPTPQQLGQQRAEQDRRAQAQAEQLRDARQHADQQRQAQQQREVQTSAEQQRRIEIQAARRAEEQQREELLAQQAEEAEKQSQSLNQQAEPRGPRVPQPEASPPSSDTQISNPSPPPAFSSSLLVRSVGIGVLAGAIAVALGKTVQRLLARSLA